MFDSQESSRVQSPENAEDQEINLYEGVSPLVDPLFSF